MEYACYGRSCKGCELCNGSMGRAGKAESLEGDSGTRVLVYPL